MAVVVIIMFTNCTFCLLNKAVFIIKSTPFLLRPHHCSHIWWECHLASLSRRLQSNDPSLTHSLNFSLILQRQDIIAIFFISFHNIQNHMKKIHSRNHLICIMRVCRATKGDMGMNDRGFQAWKKALSRLNQHKNIGGDLCNHIKNTTKQQRLPVNLSGMDNWTPKNLRVRGCIKFM